MRRRALAVALAPFVVMLTAPAWVIHASDPPRRPWPLSAPLTGPAAPEQGGSVQWYFFVGPSRTLNLYRRAPVPAATWEWTMTLDDGAAGGVGVRLDTAFAYLVDVPGPTTTIEPTPEDDTPTPAPTDTATAAPTQTPWIVTATAEPITTAGPWPPPPLEEWRAFLPMLGGRYRSTKR